MAEETSTIQNYDSQISVNTVNLKEAIGKLGDIASEWDTVKDLGNAALEQSEGASVDCIKDGLQNIDNANKALKNLLNHSVDFFSNLEVEFEETDEAASQLYI